MVLAAVAAHAAAQPLTAAQGCHLRCIRIPLQKGVSGVEGKMVLEGGITINSHSFAEVSLSRWVLCNMNTVLTHYYYPFI